MPHKSNHLKTPFLSFNPCGSVVKGLSFTSASGAQSRSSHPAWASTRTPAGSKLAQRVRKRQRPSGTEGSSLTQAWVAAGRQHQHQRRPVGSRALRSRWTASAGSPTALHCARAHPGFRPRFSHGQGSFLVPGLETDVTSGVVAKQPNGLVIAQ